MEDVSHPLRRLLPGVDLDEFSERHYGCRSLHCRGPVERLEGIYDLEAFAQMRHIGSLDAATQDENGRQVQVRIEPWQAAAMRDAGLTLCADVTSEPLLADFLDELQRRMDTGPGGFAKLYVSPPGAGFALHFDPDHVFVVQLSGRKLWRYGAQPVVPWARCGGKLGEQGMPVHTHPREGMPVVVDDRPLPAPRPDELETITMQPGDVLYLPPGTWHETRAKEDCVAISLSPPRRAALDLVVADLHARLAKDPALWVDVVPRPSEVASGPVPKTIQHQLKQIVASLSGACTPTADNLVQRWCDEVLGRGPAGPAHDDPAPPDKSDTLELCDERGLVWLRVTGEDGQPAVVLYSGGESFAFPGEAAPFVEKLAEHPRFVAEQSTSWDPSLGWDGTREVLTQLLHAGILRPA